MFWGHPETMRLRITDQKVYLDAYILNNLNERLCILKKKLSERTEVDITYF